MIRDLCILYGLPSPLAMLQTSIPKPKFKALVKSLVVDYWEVKLWCDALPLGSLKFFHPHYMSLLPTHYGLLVVQTLLKSTRPLCLTRVFW